MELDPLIASCIPKTGPLASYMRWAITTTDAEHLFHLGSILPCLADMAVSNGFFVDQKRKIRPVVWTFLVGVPASSKTTSMKRAAEHYRRVASAMVNGQPVNPFIFAEGSIPGIFEALAARYNPDTKLSTGILDRDEAARLLDARDGTIADMLCQIIDGEEVERHLRGLKSAAARGEKVHDRLIKPAFSGRLATTFARIREVTQASYLEGGLYSRMLWFVGKEYHPHPAFEMDPQTASHGPVFKEWCDWSRWLVAGQMGEDDERTVAITEEARELLRTTLFAAFTKHARTDSRLNATRKRALTQALVVAGLYALSEQRMSVTEDDMRRAINLMMLCEHGLENLDTSLAVSEQIADTEKVYRAVRSLGAPTKSALYGPTKLTKQALDIALEHLIDAGRLEARKGQHVGPGRPGTTYHAILAPNLQVLRNGGRDLEHAAEQLIQDKAFWETTQVAQELFPADDG